MCVNINDKSVVIISLKSLKEVSKRRFLSDFNDPLLSFCNLFPQKLQKTKVGMEILILIMIL